MLWLAQHHVLLLSQCSMIGCSPTLSARTACVTVSLNEQLSVYELLDT